MEKITTKKNLNNKNKGNKINTIEENFLPSKEVINNILNYSKALKVSKSKSENTYFTLLN